MSPFLAIIALGLLIVAACAGPEETSTESEDPAVVEAGAALYAASCAECHGSDLRGTDRGPSHLSVLYEPGHHGDGAFELAIKIGSPQHHWGFGPMAPVEGLGDGDIAAIIAFVREQQRIEGFEPYPP